LIRHARAEVLESRRLLSGAGGTVAVQSAAPPEVYAVYFGSTEWTPDFRAHLASKHSGHAVYGFRPSYLMPWVNVNQVTVDFTGFALSVDPDDLRVRGANVSSYPVSSLDFDPVTSVATWTLARPLGADRVIIEVEGDAPNGVRDYDGQFLDEDGGGPGGDYVSDVFRVLPGARNLGPEVNRFDFGGARNAHGRSITNVGSSPYQYDFFTDVTGDGVINVLDSTAIRRRMDTYLPFEEPAPSAAGAAAAAATRSPLRTRPVSRGLFSSDPILG
jgi:hypothetical protein